MKRLIIIAFLIATYLPITGQNDIALQQEIEGIHFKRYQQKDSLKILLRECYDQIKTATEPAKIELLTQRLDTLYNIADSIAIEQLKINLQFAKKNPNSLYCLKLINSRLTSFEAMELYDEYQSTFENFAPSIRNSKDGQIMQSRLESFKKSKVGSIAPDFEVIDINNEPLSLNEFKGKKYILIDFWASWCAPCLEELPYLKELHQKYHDNLEIISVSKDDKIENWQKSVARLQIGHWRHFAVAPDDTTILSDYFVFGIPHKLLIDKNGVIIGKWKGGGLKNKQSLQQLLKSTLE